MIPLTTLFRPVGLKELRLVYESGYQQFPPRLSWQPIFYPVTNFPYAEQITREWNVVSNGDHCGFVTAFEVKQAYLNQYQVQNVGAAFHNELWIPAEDMEQFNANLVGDIRVVASRYAEPYEGVTIGTGELRGKNIREQLAYLATVTDDAHLESLMEAHEYVFLTNLGYWQRFGTDYCSTVEKIQWHWAAFRPNQAHNTD